jgi:Ni,Fe-hydrogenase I cytochrome b subunit
MTTTSRRVAGVLLVIFPTVVIGGVSVLTLLVSDPSYTENPLRQDLWRAGHAHAGVLLLLSLIALRYVDEAHLAERTRALIRLAFPTTAVLLPLAFFLSVLAPGATTPNPLIYLAYVGAAVLIAAMLTLGIGLARAHSNKPATISPQPAAKE